MPRPCYSRNLEVKLPYKWFNLSSGTSLNVYDILNNKVEQTREKARVVGSKAGRVPSHLPSPLPPLFPPHSHPLKAYGSFKDEFTVTLKPHESVFVTLKK